MGNNFDQRNQRVNEQYNISGDLNLNKSFGILWIKALGAERYFLQKAKEQIKGPQGTSVTLTNILAGLMDLAAIFKDDNAMTSEPDFNIRINDDRVAQMNVGEIVKLSVEPGSCKVHIELNVTANRDKADMGLTQAADKWAYKDGKNVLTFPINPGEVVELEYQDMKLKFKGR
ncbi:MAG: hypothetical protein CNIPEHKO_03282 [Anaerolineales bacterium]|nr:hypothetical protein [Anaerolineales bacterium]